MNSIDKVFYINLDKRTDRKKAIEKELHNYDIYNYERFPAIEHKIGLVGCGQSHLAVLKLARERNYNRILILEDDFRFIVSKKEFEENMGKIEKVVDFDICFLSYMLHEYTESEYDFLFRVLKSQSASGYIVNKRHFDTLINEIEITNPLLEQTGHHWIYSNDVIWYKFQLQDKYYCFKTRIGIQRPGYSDNCNAYVDHQC
jgi:glycosyl transferase family 25